jgi:hypothetical protein
MQIIFSNNRQKDTDDLRIIYFPGVIPNISNHIFSCSGFTASEIIFELEYRALLRQ